MEWIDHHQYFYRTGRSNPDSATNCQPGSYHCQQRLLITPHVVKEVEGEALDTLYSKRRYTMVDRSHYDEVVQGMRAAVLGGTCRGANLPDIEVCGKTGTAQNRGKDHSAFMGFAPMNNPKIAIAVYVENGGFGAVYGVPIGRLMIEKYLKGQLSPEDEAMATEIQNRRIDYGIHER